MGEAILQIPSLLCQTPHYEITNSDTKNTGIQH